MPPLKCPSPLEDPAIPRGLPPDGISIGLSVFAELTFVTNTDRQTDRPQNIQTCVGIALRAAMRPNKSLPSCWW